MNYTKEGKNIVVLDEKGKKHRVAISEIERSMKAFQCSEQEAVDMFCDDEEITINEEQAELVKNVPLPKLHAKKAPVADGEKKKRVRKENPTKQKVIAMLADALTDAGVEVDIRNKEKYIDFNLEGYEFTINLVAHRPPKQD